MSPRVYDLAICERCCQHVTDVLDAAGWFHRPDGSWECQDCRHERALRDAIAQQFARLAKARHERLLRDVGHLP